MAVLVKNFLNLAILRDARVVAGQEGLNRRTISWISVIERPVESFVRPGEMILTCGTGCSPRMFRRFMQEIIDSGAAGIGVGTGKTRDVESVPTAIRNLANERQCPVLEIPWEVRFADITKAVVDMIVEDRNSTHAKDSVREKFTDLVLRGLGYADIATALEQVVRCPVVILGPDLSFQTLGTQAKTILKGGNLSACNSTRNRLHKHDIATLTNLLHSRAPYLCPGIPQLNLGPGLGRAIIVNRNVLGYLYVLDSRRGDIHQVPSLKLYAIEQAAIAVTIEALRKRAVAETESRLQSDFLWEVATGKIDSVREIENRATLLGYDPRKSYCLMLLRWESKSARVSALDDQHAHQEVASAIAQNALALGLRTVATGRDNATLLLVEMTTLNRQLMLKLAEHVQVQLANSWLEQIACAIGSGLLRLEDLSRAYSEVIRTLRVGRAIIGARCVADASMLRPFLMLNGLSEDPQACETANHLLAPLLKYDKNTGRNLMRTLEVYLEESGNASAAARRLFLNRHSLLYRLKKIESFTGYSLHRYQDLFLLNLSLKLWRMGVVHTCTNHEEWKNVKSTKLRSNTMEEV